jgi:uncharacterized protein YcbX
MSGVVTDLHFYPIKGLSAQRLESVQVSPTAGFPLDRCWALPKRHGEYRTVRNRPLTSRNFHGPTADARLVGIQTSFDPGAEWLEVRVRGHVVLACSVRSEEDIVEAENLFARVLDLDPEDRPFLIRRADSRYNYSYTASVSESLTWACHVVNTASLREFSQRIGTPVDPRRFRPNLTVDLGEPWAERRWLGRRFRVGDVVLTARQPCLRCAATEVNPDTAERDIPIPRLLNKYYGHTEFGLYATIESPGTLVRGLPVELIDEEPGDLGRQGTAA